MGDFFDSLPTEPKTQNKTEESPGVLTPGSIQAVISPKLYGELTNGDDTVTETCIRNGVIRTKSLLQVVGKKFIPGLPLHRQIVRLLTIYEMYIYNGDEKGGHEYLVTATDLISDNYGSVESARTQGVPAGAIVKPNRKRL